MRLPTTLEYAILGLIHAVPRSGYDVRRQFETTPLGGYSDSPGSIYPALRRLEAMGFASRRADRRSPGRGREVWSPTPRGRTAFAAWLDAPPTADGLRTSHESELLRFAFTGSAKRDASARRFLSAYEMLMRQELETAESWLDSPEAVEIPWTGREAFRLGLSTMRLRCEWAASVQRPANKRRRA